MINTPGSKKQKAGEQVKIAEAIEKADGFYPNAYSYKEKLDWCYELTVMIASEIKKIYNTLIISEGEGAQFADEILTEDIVQVWVNGRRLPKSDDRSFEDIDFSQGEIKIVYRVRPEPYVEKEAEGKFTFQNVSSEDGKQSFGSMTAEDTYFQVHDVLEITRQGASERRCVTEVNGDTYYFADPFSQTGESEAKVVRVLTEECAAPPPYDALYLYYLLGKIAFYQNDLQEYNKQMAAFNTLWDAYAKQYKQTNPLEDGVRFRNVW